MSNSNTQQTRKIQDFTGDKTEGEKNRNKLQSTERIYE